MGPSKYDCRVFFFAIDTAQLVKLHPLSRALAKAGNALYNQIVLCERARFIEAADVNLTGQWDSPWLRAEYLLLDELNDRVIDGDG